MYQLCLHYFLHVLPIFVVFFFLIGFIIGQNICQSYNGQCTHLQRNKGNNGMRLFAHQALIRAEIKERGKVDPLIEPKPVKKVEKWLAICREREKLNFRLRKRKEDGFCRCCSKTSRSIYTVQST